MYMIISGIITVYSILSNFNVTGKSDRVGPGYEVRAITSILLPNLDGTASSI